MSSDTTTEPLVSVVTPLYNTKAYLAECIESVLAQSYRNWEYTIVDNCSDDGSSEIAREYAQRDERIRVHRNVEFLDQVANLNHAFSLISPQSRYTKMLLSDDWIFPRCLEAMVALGEAHPSAGIISSHRVDEGHEEAGDLSHLGPCIPGREAGRIHLLGEVFLFGSPSTLMWRSEIVRARRPFYDASRLHEDTESCYEILREHDLGFAHEQLSFTRRQNESLTAERRVFDPHHMLDGILALLRFGRDFLEPSELEDQRRRLLGRYYDFLAERSLAGAGEDFWDYHRRGLRTAGADLDQNLLRRSKFRAVAARLRYPHRLLLAAVRRLRPSSARSQTS